MCDIRAFGTRCAVSGLRQHARRWRVSVWRKRLQVRHLRVIQCARRAASYSAASSALGVGDVGQRGWRPARWRRRTAAPPGARLQDVLIVARGRCCPSTMSTARTLTSPTPRRLMMLASRRSASTASGIHQQRQHVGTGVEVAVVRIRLRVQSLPRSCSISPVNRRRLGVRLATPSKPQHARASTACATRRSRLTSNSFSQRRRTSRQSAGTAASNCDSGLPWAACVSSRNALSYSRSGPQGADSSANGCNQPSTCSTHSDETLKLYTPTQDSPAIRDQITAGGLR